MLVSYKWLQRYVDINVTPEELGEKLTMAGITVDLVTYPYKGIENVVSGKILEITPHENADKLQVCKIDVGTEVLQIITGAKNVAVGQIVPVALVGAKLAGGVKIKKGNLRGLPSYGMLCSEQELGLAEQSQGIWILPEDMEVGLDLAKELMFDDAVLDLDLTPNRSDCLSVINVAREVAAVLDTEVRLPEITYPISNEKLTDLVEIDVQDKELCRRYVARMIKDLKVGPSPLWMQHCLRTAGVRPINNMVDVANFVMLEYGQPLHTFDFDKVNGNKIVVRRANAGEKIVTLDEKERELSEKMLVICDEEKPLCVAGVMGGENSGVTDETKTILLESAHFKGVSIRHTAKDLGLRSESSLRFEKNLDISGCDIASMRATALLCELCGGTAVEGVIDTLDEEIKDTVVVCRPKRINQVLGLQLTDEEILDCFRRLKFQVTKLDEESYEVICPAFRQDITGEIDLVEEVSRLIGLDNIPVTLPKGELTDGRLTRKQSFSDQVKKFAVSMGFSEVINYGFISPKEFDKLNCSPECRLRKAVKIMNPLNEEQSTMRTTLIPSLMKSVCYNVARRSKDLLLFEQGTVFLPVEGEELPREVRRIGFVSCGATDKTWNNAPKKYDFFFMKGILEAFCQKFGIANMSVKAVSNIPYLHPGRGGEVFLGEESIGYIGELHPAVLRNYGIKDRVVIAELDLEKMFKNIAVIPQYSSLPKFPASTRDMALVGKNEISASQIEAIIWEKGGKYLKEVKLFDVYTGEQVEEGSRSLAYGLTFQNPEDTLTDEVVNKAFDAIVASLAEINVVLR